MSEEEKKVSEEEQPEEKAEEPEEEQPEQEQPQGEQPEQEQPEEKATKKTAKKKTTKKKEKEDEDVVKDGDFLLIEMTGKAIETGEVFDTTDEELAKEEGIFSEDRVYGPKLVVVGESWILKGLDDKLPGLKLEEEAQVEIPPEEAFGERSPENVRTMPFRILRSKGVNPVVGQQVELDGRSAVVRSAGAGRVQLDYNHPLAGRRITYDVKVAKRYEGEEEKVKALLGRRFLGIDVDLFKLKFLKKKIRIQIPDEIFFGENIQIAKRGVALDIQRYFPNVDEVEYTEVIKRT